MSVGQAEADEILIGRPSAAALTAELTPRARPWSRGWIAYFTLTGAGTILLFSAIAYTITTGIGVWGNNMPVAWAFDITNFVWWIGIGHAGTFISAFLLLLEQRWRTSINRIAEAMTLFAVMNAALFPLCHLGRPWFFYWLIPFPTATKVWPNFKSALTWDVAAVTTYFTVSLLFWYLGLLPDLATARDQTTSRVRGAVYGFFALGWRGSARHWRHFNVGMWTERFNIIVTSLSQDALPSSWGVYSPTWVDFSILFGTVSFFLFLFGLFLRYFPAVATSELKEMAIEIEHEHAGAES